MQADPLASLTDEAFRAHVRGWLSANLPPDMVRRSRSGVHPSREDMLGVTALLARAGWSVPHWPVEHGGPGWSAMRAFIFEEELTLAGGPSNNIQGVSLVGPVVYTFGTQAQKDRFLAPIREGREFWAQGFSEPNSGSDLASLRTRAVREGDVYVVDGQKIWTSQAMYADWLFCLVRTNTEVKPQLGISFLLIDMKSPGVTVRPITSIDEGQSLCEVFFDAVRVPVVNLVGEEGRGWDYAKFLLGNERVQTAEVPRNMLYLARLKEIAARETRGGVPLSADPVFARRIAQAEIDLLALESAVVGAIDAQDDGGLAPSALKIVGTELMQTQLGLQVEALGVLGAAVLSHSGLTLPGAAPGPEHAEGVSAEFLFRRAATIYGGSSEVQKNIIAKMLFSGHEGPPPRLGEEQSMLREGALRFGQRALSAGTMRTATECTVDTARTGWHALVEAGFPALALPESCGGLGGAPEMAVVCEALGEGLAGGGLIAHAVLPGQALAGLAHADARRDAWLAALADGSCVFALAQADPDAADSAGKVHARVDGASLVLDGRRRMVPGGAAAQRLLIPVSVGERTALCVVDAAAPGVTLTPYRTIDGQSVADLDLASVRVAPEAVFAQADEALARARDWAVVMSCAEALGAMSRALHITRDYLNTRRQFGSPLSEFQALRHRVAEMFAELTLARAIVNRAVTALADAPAQRARMASACKARVGRAAMQIANQSVQLHGGIGMTDAYVIGRYYKRLFVFDRLFGDQAHHIGRFLRG